MKLSSVLGKSREIAVDVDGETLHIEYDPSRYTAELEDQIMNAGEKNRPVAAIAGWVSGLLTGWDLTDDQGKAYPTDYETLCALPGKFLEKVWDAITDDMNPKKAKGQTSRGGSLQRG